jgi:hypothetical protein
MAGWSREKRQAVEATFYKFLDCCYINSKDSGRICLGQSLYEGQRWTITEIFDALEADIHDIYILKSRQLGMSTLIRALTAFMIGIHKGLKGAMIFDTVDNRQESRSELESMLGELPRVLKFPGIKTVNRSGLTLDNDSKVAFMSAGIRQSKVSGTLGRSFGLSFAHCSELCSWDNPDGLEAFRASLSDVNPDRLYIFESTARGFNQWNVLWDDARKDPLHCKCIFLGWWSKDTQQISSDHQDFHVYGLSPPTVEEARKIKEVRDLYKYEVTQPQLAWIRRKMDPSAQSDGDAEAAHEGNPLRIQEQPWTEMEAFQQTGSVFFAPEKLTDQQLEFVTDKFETFMYLVLDEFAYTEVLKAPNAKMVELKVWDPPVNDAVYVLGIDPAFGTSESNARSAIQILRCYADGIDQVAEYAWPLITAQHLAWVIASLLGWYGQVASEVRYALELNGPGMAVFAALRTLKFQLENGYQPNKIKEKGLTDVFKNVRTYIYSRTDSMGPGYNYHIKTTRSTKGEMLEQLRNVVSTGKLHIRSKETIKEMIRFARNPLDGDIIDVPSGSKDDRVMAMAFAVHCWEEKMRRTLLGTNRTRGAERAKVNQSLSDQIFMFNQNQFTQFFKEKRMERLSLARQLQRASWRYR